MQMKYGKLKDELGGNWFNVGFRRGKRKLDNWGEDRQARLSTKRLKKKSGVNRKNPQIPEAENVEEESAISLNGDIENPQWIQEDLHEAAMDMGIYNQNAVVEDPGIGKSAVSNLGRAEFQKHHKITKCMI